MLRTWKRELIGLSIVILLGGGSAVVESKAAAKHAKAPKSLRLYLFDCGTIHTMNVDAYSLKKEEVGSTEMAIPCILVAHPKGTLMWDNGDIPDRAHRHTAERFEFAHRALNRQSIDRQRLGRPVATAPRSGIRR